MTRKHKHNVDEVISSLSRKKDIRIKRGSKIIEVLRDQSERKTHDLGNASWGKIDFLVNHNGFIINNVLKFSDDERA